MAQRARGMRELHLVRIEELYLRGYGSRRIAAALEEETGVKLTHRTILKDIRAIQKRWREEMGGELSLLKSAEVGRINRVEAEAWEQWFRSKEPIEKAKVETRDGENGTTRSSSRENQQRLGDADYLKVIMSCSERRTKLLGLEQVDATDSDELTTEDIIKLALNPAGYGSVPGSLPPEAYLARKEIERGDAPAEGVADAEAD